MISVQLIPFNPLDNIAQVSSLVLPTDDSNWSNINELAEVNEIALGSVNPFIRQVVLR